MSCLLEANRFVTTFKERSTTGSLLTREILPFSIALEVHAV
jgi:hypothetical protein